MKRNLLSVLICGFAVLSLTQSQALEIADSMFTYVMI